MLRIRTSTLEAFRRLVQTDYGDEAELIQAVLRGQEGGPENWMMAAGTAWHRALAGEDPDELVEVIESPNGDGPTLAVFGDYRFDTQHIEAARRIVGPGVCEVPGRMTLDVFGTLVSVEGTADHVCGPVIQDHKTKFSTPDARDYEHSLQWRLYLLIHQAQRFRYNLWAMKDPDENTGYCELRDVVRFSLYPYAAMEADCRRWVGEFLDWCHGRRLTEYLHHQRKTVPA